VWFRGRGGILPSGPDPITRAQLRQAILAYYSDDTIMDNALFPHGWMTHSTTLQTASLDHVMWFHGDYRLDEWLFFDQDSPVAAGARGMTRGTVSKPDGTRVASIFQEIFMRPQVP
jgi:acyl-CoA thioesterase-2